MVLRNGAFMLTHSKKKRRRLHALEKAIVFLLERLETHLEDHEHRERIRHFIHFLRGLYE
jgi:hypothetical protein